jgi:transposase
LRVQATNSWSRVEVTTDGAGVVGHAGAALLRDLPDRYGPWETVSKRFARWQTDGTWARVEAALRTQADRAGELDWDAQIDSSVVRAPQHAAGARKGGSPRSRRTGSRRWGGRGAG